MTSFLKKRRAGVLLHITSLPGAGENGDLGREAYNFVNFLADIGVTVWQTLPLTAPHSDGSPYQSLSAHAGNPALISIEWLLERGWLSKHDCSQDCHATFEFRKSCLIVKAFQGFLRLADAEEQRDFQRFCREKALWLDDFAMFMGLRNLFSYKSWIDWPEDLRLRRPEALRQSADLLKDVLAAIKFEQYVFFRQWQELKAYAATKNVLLFGDVPIFVSYDSADVWANPAAFKLNAQGKMEVVAGVPPDYFSEFGQRWGNPHYDWSYHQRTKFAWWLQRITTLNEMFDIVRIDHFRGFEAAWEVPAHEETAINGKWVKAPGAELLRAIQQAFPSLALVAEDLGIITEEVEALRDEFNLPGMKILQFAFDGNNKNPYLPMNYPQNCVVYTGTHDNDTTLGWFEGLSPQERDRVFDYLGWSSMPMPNALVYAAMASVASLAVIPMQDLLHLDSHHRMNTPGTTEGNWRWRFSWQQVDDNVGYLRHLIHIFGR